MAHDLCEPGVVGAERGEVLEDANSPSPLSGGRSVEDAPNLTDGVHDSFAILVASGGLGSGEVVE
jgi:hypothetical protein